MEREQPRTTGDTRSELSGSAGEVVQARDVSGGIHFHGPPCSPRGPVPRQLPRGVRDFVGRDRETARLDAILRGPGGGPPEVVAITGTAGVGKTSLAVRWAHRIQEGFPDGTLYVNLRGYGPEAPVGPAEILESALHTLGVPPGSVPAHLEERSALFRSLLAGHRLLVVLDNAATAGQVRPLLPGSGDCLVLVTSRSRLSGLVARDGAHRLSLEILSEQEAVDLVRATTEGYRPADEAADLAELAGLCAYLPLALRIAAERAASRPHDRLADLIRDLRGESSLWDALSTDDGDEADSVRAVFSWSYRALPAAAAQLFRLLGLHPGSDIGPEAAAALAGQPAGQVRRLLDLLAGAHLLQQGATGRYRFHDLLRAYSAGQAHTEERHEDQRQALYRLLTWYLHTAAAASAALQNIYAAPDLVPHPPEVVPLAFAGHGDATRWYREERGNLADLTLAAHAHGFDRVAWQLPAVLHGIHVEGGQSDDWFAMGRIALRAAERAGDREGAALSHNTLGNAYLKAARTRAVGRREAVGHLRAAVEIFRAAGLRQEQADAVNNLGLVHLSQRRLYEGLECFESVLALSEESGDRAWNAVALGNLASTHALLGDPAATTEFATRALEAHRALGRNPSAWVDPLLELSGAHRLLGRPAEALEHAEQALAIAEDLDSPLWRGAALLPLGHAQRACGRHAEALATYQLCAATYRGLADRSHEAVALDATGEALSELGRYEEAADFHRTAALTHRELEDRWLQAVAVEHVAGAVERTGGAEDAGRLRAEAAELIAGYDDPQAVRMRERIAAAGTGGEAHRPHSSE